MVALLAPAPNSSLMAGLRARLNNCCAIVSNIQPMLATLSTNQWYPVNSRHHAYFCPPAPSTVGDMKLLFYIVAVTRSPTFSGVSQGRGASGALQALANDVGLRAPAPARFHVDLGGERLG